VVRVAVKTNLKQVFSAMALVYIVYDISHIYVCVFIYAS
jgi:hypothetical protein